MLLNICLLKTSEQSEKTVNNSSTLSYNEAKLIDSKLTRLLGLKVWFLNCRCISITWYLVEMHILRLHPRIRNFRGSAICILTDPSRD